MSGNVLFQVINSIGIPGQWLRAGDIFNVIPIEVNKGALVLVDKKRKTCNLNFYCENILDKTKEEILFCIRQSYNENTFILSNPYEVELI